MSNKITKKFVDSALCEEGKNQTIYWDSDLKGFGVRVTPTRKTYIVQTRVGGKCVRVTIGAHGTFTPEQARHDAKQTLVDMGRGLNPNQFKKDCAAKGVTLNEAYQTYIASRKLSETTLRDYDKAMRLGFHDWADKPVTAISRGIVESRFNLLSEKSAAQANQMFRFLRALLNFAKEKYAFLDGEPLFASNPCDRLTALKKWHAIPRRTRYLEPHQIKPWFDALDKLEYDTEHTRKDFCIFVLLTGCREQEAAQLKWENVDLVGGTVSFVQTKNHKTHMLPLGSWLKNLITQRHKTHGSGVYVFPANNQYGHLKDHFKSVRALGKISGVEFTMHDLRRTFAKIVTNEFSYCFSVDTIDQLLAQGAGDIYSAEKLREPMGLIEGKILSFL